jgi:hypothetical protein
VTRRGRQRDTGLASLSNDEIVRRAHDQTLPKDQRKRYEKEEKARELRNKQRRTGS